MNNPIATTEEYDEYMIFRGKCPVCEHELEQVTERQGDLSYSYDTYVIGVGCSNCNYYCEF